MLQASEIQQRFTAVQQVVRDAERVLDATSDASPELRTCLHELARETREAQQIMQSNEEARMVACIDRLEDMGDEAKRISRSDNSISAALESSVSKVHAELSKLKHQLH